MKTITLELPTDWAVAIFYSDLSRLDDDDIEEMNAYDDDDIEEMKAFFDWAHKNYGPLSPVELSDGSWFAKYHDAEPFGVLACDVAEYTFIVAE